MAQIESDTSPTTNPFTIEMLSALRPRFASLLADFNSSSAQNFKVIHTVPSKHAPSISTTTTSNLRTSYILDSSFNPPTRAHLTIALNALLRDEGSRPARVILLLATQNADKAPKPAAFEDRLVMMTCMAQNLRRALYEQRKDEEIAVNVAVTKKPYFMDKAASIDDSGLYPTDAQQVHLVGYDTIIRIFNSKYYPEDKKLSVLDPFLRKHRLRVCYREDGEVSRDEQESYVEAIGDGSREEEGMRREWAFMVKLVDDASEVRGVSSTKSREAAEDGRFDDLKELIGEELAQYVIENKLYQKAVDE